MKWGHFCCRSMLPGAMPDKETELQSRSPVFQKVGLGRRGLLVPQNGSELLGSDPIHCGLAKAVIPHLPSFYGCWQVYSPL